jgi:hypothetical protein
MKKTVTFLALGALLATGYQGRAQFSEDFESTSGTAMPTGWTQNILTPDLTHGWLSGTNTTLGSTYFPMYTHTRYMCVNDDRNATNANGDALLATPTFDIPASWTHPYLSFDCAYLGRSTGTTPDTAEVATVEISTDGGTTWSIVQTLSGNTAYWWEPRYINLSAYAGMTGVKLGFRYKDGGAWLYGYAVDNVKVYDPPTDMAITSLSPATGSAASYALGGATVNITGTVFNNGATAVPSYTMNYVFNGGAVVSTNITTPVAAFSAGSFTASTPVTMPTTVGSYPLLAWISMSGDTDPSNDTAKLDTLNTVSFMPKKRIFFEEPTGTWCGWCVRGIVYMDSLNQLHGNDVSIVSVHNSDPMQADNSSSSAYDTYMGTLISGYPSLVVDRDPAVGDPSDAFTAYNQLSSSFAFATIDFNTTMGSGGVTTAVDVTPATALNGDYRLELVITEDSVHGTTSGWEQHNYYSGGGSGAMHWGPYNFATLPSTVPATTMYYDFVARTTYPTSLSANPNGVAGSLPATMAAGTTYHYTFPAVSLGSSWDVSKLKVIVALINASTGRVLNSTHTIWTLGVKDVNAGVQGVKVFPNPATEETHIAFNLSNAGNVGVTVYDAVGRVVYTLPTQQMNSGDQMINVPVDGFAAGVYNAVITTENGKVTERFTVAK